jgi:hypothetical protein
MITKILTVRKIGSLSSFFSDCENCDLIKIS